MFRIDLQLFGGGGSKSGLGGGGGPFGDLSINVNENKRIVYGFVYKDENGKQKFGNITARNEGNAEDLLKSKGINYFDKSLMAKNFLDKAREIAKETGKKIDLDAAKKAYKKAYKKYLG